MNRPRRLAFALMLAAVLIASSSAHAQLTIGISGGMYSANFSGDKPEDSTYRGLSSLTASMVFEYEVAPEVRVSVQPGLATTGATIAFDVPGTEDETRDSVKVEIDYVSVPILARVVSSNRRWFVTGGPILGFLSDASGTDSATGESSDVSDSFESHDVSLLFGIGHMVPVGGIDLFAEVRWVQGLMNISAREDVQARVRNGGSQLLVGGLYTFEGR